MLLASANGILLDTTNATTILSITPSRSGLYVLTPYVVVQTAATTLSLSLTWTDPDTGAQESYRWYDATQVPVGVALQAPVLFRHRGGSPITLSAMAGTANRVRISAALEARR